MVRTMWSYFAGICNPEAKKREKLDKYLAMLERSGVGKVLKETKADQKFEDGRPSFNRYRKGIENLSVIL